MTEHKYTDEEVTKLVGVYVERKCNKCNVKDLRRCCTSCFIGVLPQAIEIINRQKAEIERLREFEHMYNDLCK
jgi:hypothetical protein